MFHLLYQTLFVQESVALGHGVINVSRAMLIYLPDGVHESGEVQLRCCRSDVCSGRTRRSSFRGHGSVSTAGWAAATGFAGLFAAEVIVVEVLQEFHCRELGDVEFLEGGSAIHSLKSSPVEPSGASASSPF